MNKKLNIGVVGLGFGGAFVDIYKHHPNVGNLRLFDTNTELMNRVCEHYQVDCACAGFEEMLADASLDAIHLVTPIPLHEQQTIAVLEAGKHCACTVPMAISLEGIQKITDTVRRTGKKYMMMETTLYTYQFFYVQELIKAGKIGKIQFLRGAHYQDMVNWPDYWMGLPPMYYGTHAIGPLVVLSGSRVKRVFGFGTGTMDEWLTRQYGNPYPVECAVLDFENGLKAEATRSLFECARPYQEGLHVYGSEGSFNWGFHDNDPPYFAAAPIPDKDGKRGGWNHAETVDLPNYHHHLPEEIQRFTVGGKYDPLNPQESLIKGAGGGHHGSHPHMVHEFLMSIVEDRKPWIDEVLSANITAAGICAHLSAMKDSLPVDVPVF